MSKTTRKVYRIKYKITSGDRYHYKYYTALNKTTAEAMFRSGFRHTHGDNTSGNLDFYQISVKRYGKWREEVELME